MEEGNKIEETVLETERTSEEAPVFTPTISAADHGQYRMPEGASVPEPAPALPEQVRRKVRGLCGLAAVFSVGMLICLYKNHGSVLSIVWAAASVLLALRAADIMERPVSLWGKIWLAGIVLLSCATCLTENEPVITLTWCGIFGMSIAYLLEFSRGLGDVSPLTAVLRGLKLQLTAVFQIPLPFQLLRRRAGEKKTGAWKTVGIVLLTVAVCVPFLIGILALLASADRVFESLMEKLWNIPEWIRLDRIVSYLFWLIGGFFAFFCLSSASGLREESGTEKKETEFSPLPAVIGLSLFGLFYGIFCAIQIAYLFGGGFLRLPDGITYAEYAREGFFQLCFVAFFNLFAVLFVTALFRRSRAVKGLLTFLCGCTYVMIASAAYRMILYIRAYDLSFLRILVLWFLPVLAVLLTGALISIFRKGFPLTRFLLTAALVGWLVFAFARPDAMAARYNLTHSASGAGYLDTSYLIDETSEDATPVLLEYAEAFPKARLEYRIRKTQEKGAQMGLRGFNFSVRNALKAVENYRSGQ